MQELSDIRGDRAGGVSLRVDADAAQGLSKGRSCTLLRAFTEN